MTWKINFPITLLGGGPDTMGIDTPHPRDGETQPASQRDIYRLLLADETIRGEQVAWMFRWILYGIVLCLAMVKQFLLGQSAGLFGMALCVTPILYNILLIPLIRRRAVYSWIRYLSVTIDIMSLTLFNAYDTFNTSVYTPVTSATLLLYQALVFLASLRLDRVLIVYSTLLSIALMNALYAVASPGFNPEITAQLISVGIAGQIYRSLYLAIGGILLLFIPDTIKRLLRTQQNIYEDYRITYEMARKDTLTGLTNRRGLDQRLAQEMAIARENGTRLAVFFLDLDRFKPINDTHGHEAGDAVLRETARRLVSAVRNGDLVARIGGDEFVILLTPMESAASCRTLKRRITDCIEKPYDLGGMTVHIGVSIGIAVFSNEETTPDGLVEKADLAMLAAKKRRR
jgi:diguanylate cyclase (GGDEF)-like protein